MHELSSMTIVVNKNQLLQKLRKNREQHAKIVAEARLGYVAKAKEELLARLDQLSNGKLVGLHFSITPPIDQTKIYDTAIRMLELHVDDEIELDAGQVRNLEMDMWDWSPTFYATNARYSNTAQLVGSMFIDR